MSTFDITAGADCMEQLTAIGIAAAAAILKSRGDGGVHIKADGSPVTRADLAAEAVIRDGLSRAVATMPIVSEEQAELEHPNASANYFLVDPLDGTREFIAGRDEYTVNIGLVSDGAPILGVIVAPAGRVDLARHRWLRRRALGIFVGQGLQATGNSRPPPPGRRAGRHGQPLAP